ncbi:hypothetical protein BH23ACT5_BH23ACT5_07520 [soil metagenome]
MSSQITVPASTTDRHDTRPASRARRHPAPAQFRVSLSPLLPGTDLDGSPTGYLARPDTSQDDLDIPEALARELAILSWTTKAVGALHPDEYIAVTVTPEVALAPDFGRTVSKLACERLMLVFETARVGRRRQTLTDAVAAARRFGVRLGVSGQRVTSADGFDAFVVTPSTCALTPPSGAALIIAAELQTEEDLEWARSLGADLFEGPVLVDPMTVAPVDLRRLDQFSRLSSD